MKLKFTGTIRLRIAYPNGWQDFLQASGIADTQEHKDLFCDLFSNYGDTCTKWTAYDYLTQRLKTIIEIAAQKQQRLQNLWETPVNDLLKKTDGVKQYSTGDFIEDGTNYDKFLNLIQDSNTTDPLIKYLGNYYSVKQPREVVLDDLLEKVFLPI